jgi:DnaJ-related protein SCJ1
MTLSPSGFSKKELKNSYYTLSKRYHPDKDSSQEARIIYNKVLKANEILSSPSKKIFYDLFG